MENSKYNQEWFESYPSQHELCVGLDAFESVEQTNNRVFWQCFGGKPDFEGLTIVDIGCGRGSLCIDIATSTSSGKVIGVDIGGEEIDFAKWNLHANYPRLESRVEFHCIELGMLHLREVDVFIAKDSFEHIFDLPEVLKTIKIHLEPGGRLFAGFNPLWHSPFGAHPNVHNCLPFPRCPWLHLLLSKRSVLHYWNLQHEKPALSIADLTLNMLSISDYLRIFKESGLRTVYFRTNLPGKSLKSRVMSYLRQFRILEKYMTNSIWAILEK